MLVKTLAAVLERFSELVEGKMAVSKAAEQVAKELRDFDDYCSKEGISPRSITKDNLKKCYYKWSK